MECRSGPRGSGDQGAGRADADITYKWRQCMDVDEDADIDEALAWLQPARATAVGR